MIEKLQDYVVMLEGGEHSLSKPQCQEVIRHTLVFLHSLSGEELFELLDDAHDREVKRNRGTYP